LAIVLLSIIDPSILCADIEWFENKIISRSK